ncbi:MAG: beta strand repeat-containing protein [Promethearchaeota archaeon]
MPSNYSLYGKIAPNYSINIAGGPGNYTWYEFLETGENSSLIALNGLLNEDVNGTFEQSMWDTLGNGSQTIRFYANDTSGNMNWTDVIIRHDIDVPSITINFPEPNELFGSTAPDFDVTITDPSGVNTTWYTIVGSSTNFTFSGSTGTINETAWDDEGNGTVTIRFYANDTSGNMNWTDVTVRQDIDVPSITINSPDPNELFGSSAPVFDVTITDSSGVNTTWYTIVGSSTNFTFSGSTGIINESAWDGEGNGTVTIRFYANDTMGNINWDDVTVRQDINVPSISINSPDPNELFGSSAPEFNVTITDSSGVNTTWYTIVGSAGNFTFSGSTGTINESAWDGEGNGTVTIRFYANDTIGNVNWDDVTVRQDLDGPSITINSPYPNELFGETPPEFDVTITDSSGVNTTWYTIIGSGTNFTFSGSTGTINESIWDGEGNGTVIIRFYANDTAGNMNWENLTVRKDIESPSIAINSPDPDELFGDNAPEFDVTIIDSSGVNTTWYTIIGSASNFTFSGSTGTINESAWDGEGNGTVTIRFYANDTAGNMNWEDLTVRKDIESPSIVINTPDPNELFGDSAPEFDMTITDSSGVNTTWYTIIGSSTNFTFSGSTGTINESAWDGEGNGTVTIRFYANDTTGNINWEDLTVRKDIESPSIAINTPDPNELFGDTAPEFDVTITDSSGVNTTWYTIIGSASNFTFSGSTGTINESAWDGEGNGTVTIRFYANDTMGNINWEEVTIRQDIEIPLITINSPDPNELFGVSAPEFDVTITDSSGVNTTWYTIVGSASNFTFSGSTGTINESAWDGEGNGTVTIRFYANDTAGNINWEDLIVRKDIESPLITIHSPYPNELFGSAAPGFDVTITESSGVNTTWYTVIGSSTNFTFSGSTGTINESAWDGEGNGTVTIRFYANDTVGNMNWEDITVRKDIESPSITINSPYPNELFGSIAPGFDVSIIDSSGVNTTWYTIVGSASNFTFTGSTGTINESVWDAEGNGTVTIRFYANDTMGNINWKDIMVRQDINDPLIIINSPEPNELFGSDAPGFDVTITDSSGVNTTWYTIIGSSINFTFSGSTGTFNESAWDGEGNGTVTIRFYANDTAGNMNWEDITVRQDIEAPFISINSPEPNDLFGSTVPGFDVLITDSSGVNTTWYTIVGSATNFTFSGSTGTIDEFAWDGEGNGTVTIRFYANDTAGNINWEDILVRKDIESPSITINSPDPYELFGASAPGFVVSITDSSSVNTTWYTIIGSGTNFTFTGSTGTINETIWDAEGNGTVTIRFYANDTAGNTNWEDITVRKDIEAPFININSPEPNDLFGSTAPGFNVLITDSSGVNTTWYTIIGSGTNFTFTGSTGMINETTWDGEGNGTVTIRFYANDTMGNIDWREVTVRQDIEVPLITINSPEPNELFGDTAPEFNVTITDSSGVNTTWYTIIGSASNFTFTGSTGTIDEDAWDAEGNGTVTIRFYANDTAGNIKWEEVTVRQDIDIPSIIINSPDSYELFGTSAPGFDVTITDSSGLNTTWYTIIGSGTNFTFSGSTGTIDEDAWDAEANGTVIIRFYANDTAGNINWEDRIVRRDIESPSITINSPDPYDLFGTSAPGFDVTITDSSGVNTTWYTIVGVGTNFTFSGSTGPIDEITWDMVGNGTIIIIFYANDTLNNVAFTNVSVYQDSLSPIITIYDPEPGALFGIPAPAVNAINVSVYDDHLQSVEYQLDNGSVQTAYREWTGFIHQEEWDKIGNGTVTLRFLAIDSVFNLNSSTLLLRKNIFDPIIIITDPTDFELFGINPPDITLYTSSAAIDTIWYRIYNGTFSTANVTWGGSINMSSWNVFGNGTLSITFYMNDTLGNLGLDSLDLRKDVISPTIIISSPSPFTLTGTTPPDISVSYYDENSISSILYQLQDLSFTTPLSSWTGSITLSDWNDMSNGTVTIIFRAEDIVGNVAFANITVRKDIVPPEFFIFYPDNDTLYSFDPPLIICSIIDGSGIANSSYQLINSVNTSSIREWNNTIDQALWAQFGNGTITIYIFAYDIIGNIGNITLQVRKDIISPFIEIQSPTQYEEFGRDSPFFEVNITDGNLDTSWYVILGTDEEIPFTGPFGRINPALWELIWDNMTINETITIRFYANDTVGNENYVDLLLVKAQPSRPFQIISNPLGLIFSTLGLVVMFPITWKVTKSRYYQNLNKKEKSKLKKVIITAVVLLSVTFLFYIF